MAHPSMTLRYQFMPFGAGPKVCIGAAFALIEATAMLTVFVRAARFGSLPAPEPIPVSRVVVRPKHERPESMSQESSEAVPRVWLLDDRFLNSNHLKLSSSGEAKPRPGETVRGSSASSASLPPYWIPDRPWGRPERHNLGYDSNHGNARLVIRSENEGRRRWAPPPVTIMKP